MKRVPTFAATASQPRPLAGILGGLLLLTSQAGMAEPATIELADGSTLRGEVRSLKGGSYEIETRSLGIVRIPQQDVALVSYQPATAESSQATPQSSGSQNTAGTAVLAQMQAQLTKDPGTLAMIMSLTDDPDVQAVINDPAIQAAISSGNFASLMENPKIKALMAHPMVQRISDQAR